MAKKYDETDMAILREIRDHSRESHRKLAERLGIHPNTLIQRIKRLEDEGVIIKYSTDIDYRKTGYDIHALVMLRTKKMGITTFDTIANIAKFPQVVAFYATTGNYDAIATVRCRGRDELVEVLKRMQNIQGVLRTTSFIVLATYKEPYEFNPLLDTMAKE